MQELPQLRRKSVCSTNGGERLCLSWRNEWICQLSNLTLNRSLCKMPPLIFFFPFYKIICNHSWWWYLFANFILWFLPILLSQKTLSRLQDRPLCSFWSMYLLVLIYFSLAFGFSFALSFLPLALLLTLSFFPFHSVSSLPHIFGMWRECRPQCLLHRAKMAWELFLLGQLAWGVLESPVCALASTCLLPNKLVQKWEDSF